MRAYLCMHMYMHVCPCVKQYAFISCNIQLQVPAPMPAFPQQNAATTSAPPQLKVKKPRNKKRMGEHVHAV